MSSPALRGGVGGVPCCLATPKLEEQPSEELTWWHTWASSSGACSRDGARAWPDLEAPKELRGRWVLLPRAGLSLGLVSRDLEILGTKLKDLRTQEKLLSLFTVGGS